MPRFVGVVLLDNCAINGAVKAGYWKALLGRGRLETVEEVAREAGSFFRKRADQRELADSFRSVVQQPVDTAARVALAARLGPVALDDGERDLWAHALGRTDHWLLCGPDVASLKAAVRLGLADRLVSLEALLEDVGLRPRGLGVEQTEKWLRTTIGRLKLEAGRSA